METKNHTGETNSADYLLYGLGGLILATGGFIGIRYLINRLKENIQQNQSIEDGASATYAKQLNMAFENNGWWGTDVPMIRQVLQELPTKESFEEVRKSYQKLYHANLIRDLTEELTNTEYNEMISIVSNKPSRDDPGGSDLAAIRAIGWAKRLNAAVNYSFASIPGTDEDAILAVFSEIPTQGAYQLTAAAYQKLYGVSLEEDLSWDLEFWEIGSFMDIIKRKPL